MINRQDLVDSLLRVQHGLSPRAFIEQSSSFAFIDGWVCTYNEEVCCRTRVPGLKLSGAVNARKLLDVLSNLTDTEVSLEATTRELKIRGTRKGVDLRLEAEITLPIDQVEVPSNDDWKDLPENFLAGLSLVMGTAGNDSEEFFTVCVHCTQSYIETCDRKQATRYSFEKEKLPIQGRFLVRAKSVAPVIPMGLNLIAETDQWVHFSNRRPAADSATFRKMIYSARRHLDDYQTDRITQMIASFQGEPAVLPQGAAEAAKLGAVFSSDDKDDNKVLVSLSNRKMIVRGEGAAGRSWAEMDMSYSGPDVSFRISPEMLQTLIKEKKTECEVGGNKLRVVGDHWTYLAVLGKTEAVKDAPEAPAGADDSPVEDTRDEE